MSETTKGEDVSLDPHVTDAPEAIWLVYGDIDRTDTHASCCRHGEVTWCEDAQFATDVRYVRADKFDSLSAEVSALRALCAAMYQAAGAYGMPVRFLDALSAAANGQAFNVDGLLPCDSPDYVQQISELQARLEAWRFTPVSERLPETDCRALVLYQSGKSGNTRAMFARYSGGRWRFVDDRSRT